MRLSADVERLSSELEKALDSAKKPTLQINKETLRRSPQMVGSRNRKNDSEGFA